MTRGARRNHTPAFKAKVALAALKGEKTLRNWRRFSMCIRTRSRRRNCSKGGRSFRGRGDERCSAGGFESASCQDRRAGAGERFFGRCAHQGRHAERKATIDRTHDLPIVRQAKVLNISRGCVYCQPKSVSDQDLALMRRIDELHLEYPFAGSRMLRDFLNREGVEVGRRHVGTLMKRMGIEALYRKPNTAKPTPGNKIYPYLLRGLKVERPTLQSVVKGKELSVLRGFSPNSRRRFFAIFLSEKTNSC